MSSLSEAARGLPPSKGAARNKVEVRLQGSHPSSGIHQVSTYPCLWSTLHMLLPFPSHDYPVGLQLGHSLTLRGRAFPRAVHVGDTITTRTRRVSAARLAFCLLCLSMRHRRIRPQSRTSLPSTLCAPPRCGWPTPCATGELTMAPDPVPRCRYEPMAARHVHPESYEPIHV